MASKRMSNRLYWGVVRTTRSDTDASEFIAMIDALRAANAGMSDRKIEEKFHVSDIFTRYDIRGGVFDLNRASRNNWSRSIADTRMKEGDTR